MSASADKKTPKHQRRAAEVIATLVVVVILLATIVAYSSAQTAQLYSYAESSAQKTCELGAQEISATVEYGKSSIKSAANSLAASMTSDTLDNPSESITPLIENTPFDAIEYIRADGMNVMNAGTPFDASTRTYYVEGVKGNTGIWNNYHPKTSQDVLMNFYTPLVRNGQIVGVITGYIEGNTTMAPAMKADFFGEPTYGLLYDSDGMVIAYTESGEFQADLTLDTFLGQFSASESQKAQLLDTLTSTTDGAVVYSGPDGDGLVCLAQVQGTDWTMATFIPASSLGAVLSTSRIQSGLLIAVIVVLAVAFLIFTLVRARRERKRLSEENMLLDQVVLALAADYQNAFLINVRLGTSRAIFLDSAVEARLGVGQGVAHSYKDACERYIAARFYSEDVDAMRKNMELSNVMAQLEGADEYIGSFRVLDEGCIHHFQFKYRAIENTDYVIMGFLNIDSMVAAESERAAQLERLNHEQEEHIEEVSALNSELEERQAQLEEVSAEQEAQIEEIAELNGELAEAKAEAEAANVAKSTFLFNMSHDIRTPMNAIIGFTNLLEKHQDEPKRRADYLAKIKGSSASLLSIINNVLDMARIESGAAKIDEIANSAEQFNVALSALFEGLMAEKNIRFTCVTDVEHPYCYIDPTKVTQIFSNILSNAWKYTEPGGEVTMITKEIPSEREGWVVFRTSVADTGIGMDADFIPHIFEEFSRERASTETKVEGTGLGMPIVKHLVDLMDGTIEVESRKGVGTTITVTMPHRIAEGLKIEEAAAAVDPALFAGRRILLAEDNDLNAEIAIEILSEAGFKVERAEDGVIAVEMLKSAENGYYDVVLMDVQMPNMNGYEATQAIRAFEDPVKAGISILAMTANAFEEDKREAFNAGMNGHIAKPINVSDLMRALSGALS